MSDSLQAYWNWPVAVSCFGAQRALGALPLVGDLDALRRVQQALYERGEDAKKTFADNTMLFGAFQFGDKAQSAMAGFAQDAMTLKVLSPSYMMDAIRDVVRSSTDAMDAVGTGDARSLLQEQFRNTGDVIGFVNHNNAPWALSADGTYPLDAEVASSYSQGDYPALWLVEGLGERYAEAYLAEGGTLTGLLSEGPAAALPEKTRLMMHAGIGITFAKREAGSLTPWSSETEIRAALERFLQIVRANSMAGYEGAAIESLGLVTRTWYPQMVSILSEQLLAVDADARAFFWHGAGRAMLFSPMNMLPGLSPWEAADREPTDDVGRLNARAGVAWAFTIVNVRQPAIAANFLRHRASRIADNTAYTNGVQSTLIMAGDMVPGHHFITEFCAYTPEPGDDALDQAWERHIGTGLLEKLNSYREALRTHGKLGEVFRYHDLSGYVAALKD